MLMQTDQIMRGSSISNQKQPTVTVGQWLTKFDIPEQNVFNHSFFCFVLSQSLLLHAKNVHRRV